MQKTTLLEGPMYDYITYLSHNKGFVYKIGAIARYTPTMIAKFIGFKKPYVLALSKQMSKLEEEVKKNPNDPRFSTFFLETVEKSITELLTICPKSDVECNKVIYKFKDTKEEVKKTLPKILNNFGVSTLSIEKNNTLLFGGLSLASGIVASNILHSTIQDDTYPEASEHISRSVFDNLNVFKIVKKNISLLTSDQPVIKKVIAIICISLILVGVSILSYKLFTFLSNKIKRSNTSVIG